MPPSLFSIFRVEFLDLLILVAMLKNLELEPLASTTEPYSVSSQPPLSQREILVYLSFLVWMFGEV